MSLGVTNGTPLYFVVSGAPLAGSKVGGGPPCPFLKIEKNALFLQKSDLILGECTLFVCIYGLRFSFKM